MGLLGKSKALFRASFGIFMELSPVVDALVSTFEVEKSRARDGGRFSVSRTVSTIAALYEKARNAVEFRAEHLVRRAAIERILKRRVALNGGTESVAENLVVELLWARYIDSSLIDDIKVREIHGIVERYLTLKHELFGFHSKHGNVSWDTILGLMSSEIEDSLVSAKKREALTHFFYQSIRPIIRFSNVDERYVNIQTYIAIERAYSQSDDALILYQLMKMIQPTWFKASTEKARAEFALVLENIRLVEQSLKDPVGEPLTRFVRRHAPPFLLLRDFFFAVGKDARKLLENKEEFERKLAEIASQRYQETGARVRRAMVRSIIYIFLTKMVFALALEAPVDLLITKRIEYLALGINTLFPPVMLFLIAGFFSVPGAENTRRLSDRIEKIMYHFDSLKEEKDVFSPKPHIRRPILTSIFSVFYLGTFLLVFGFINWALTALHFNWASKIIFVFFVTLVSFFAYRIRVSTKEYEMVDRQGFISPVMDFFFLPILRVGHILSREIAKINVFIFFFDFILEAPLKVIFEVAEEWIRFIRAKKDEIV